MRPTLFQLLSALFLALFPMGARAQIFSAGGQFSAMDNSRYSARSAAMGSAFVGVADDATALLSNPAGLAGLDRGEFDLHSNFWLVNTLEETAVVGIPAGGAGVFGVAGTYVDYGNFSGTDELGNPTSGYGANRMELEVGWGKTVLRGFSLGAAVRGSQTTLEHNSTSLFAADLGILIVPREDIRLGFSLVNAGLGQGSDPLAAAFNVGGSYKISFGKTGNLLASVGGVIEPKSVNYLQAGAEFVFEGRYSIRAGYQSPMGGNGLEGLTGLTFGAGIVLADLALDYAYLPYGDLGASHRVSLGYHFAAAAPQPVSGSLTAPVTVIQPSQPVTVIQEAPGNTIMGTMPQPGVAAKPGEKDSMTVRFDFSSEAVAQAQELEKKGSYQEAVKVYLDILKSDPDNGQAWGGLGGLYYKFNQKADALRCYEHLLKLKPDDKALADWLEKYRLAP